ncbi:thiosulfate oxidation carrier protein SoxY [Pontibacter sp. JAM-7]|uniref:thiosulfate oxidation carrier protein SoxY n=1 Tax=Pontibacter sp. JAM-7 TaxID=3366581 RepID=UPI003AF8F996
MSIKRRAVIKAIAAGSALVGFGVLLPRLAYAAWNEQAFRAKDQANAMQELFGAEPELSAEITLKAPDIAENGAVVPVTVSSTLTGVESISLFVEHNPTPLVMQCLIPEGTDANISTRIRMGKTSKVTAVVQAEDKLYSAVKEVKVTIGGCGG